MSAESLQHWIHGPEFASQSTETWPFLLMTQKSRLRDVYDQSFYLRSRTHHYKPNLYHLSKERRRGVKCNSVNWHWNPQASPEQMFQGGTQSWLKVSYKLVVTHAMHTVILPKKHQVLKILIQYYHHIAGHWCRGYTLPLTRQRYWIIIFHWTL